MRKADTIFVTVFFIILLGSCNKATSSIPNDPVDPADQTSFATADAINKRLGRGINLGDTYESSWSAPGYHSEYMKKIAESGFKTVRIPIRWELPARSLYIAPYTITASFLSEIKSVIDDALKNKLHVIINMHHHDSLYANPDGMKPMFIAQWRQIADYFKNYPDSLLFEVLNEPHDKLDAQRWNVFFDDALKEIRKSNPKRTVLLGTANWGGLGGLQNLSVPADDRLILTIHYYNPFHFTHQGAEWVAGSDPWLGTKWYDTEYERQTVTNEFNLAIQFAKEKKLPVNVGEFGAYSKAEMASRVRWTRYLARWFEEQDFSWAYWEFNSGFGIYDPSSGQFRTELVNALTKDVMVSPAASTLVNLYSCNFSNPQADGWGLYNNDASAASTMAVNNNKINVTITSPGKENWHIQLIRQNLSIEVGKMYRVEFNAYSNTGRSIVATIMQSAAPWSAYGENTFDISSADTKYSFVFTAPATDTHCNFVFSLGKNGNTPVTIYDIKLQEVKL